MSVLGSIGSDAPSIFHIMCRVRVTKGVHRLRKVKGYDQDIVFDQLDNVRSRVAILNPKF
jgi:hypothetical protein